MLLKIRDSFAKDELVIPPENLMRWYQQQNIVDIFFKDGQSSVRYNFATEADATKFNVDLCTGYRMSKVSNHVIYCATVEIENDEEDEEEETPNENEDHA